MRYEELELPWRRVFELEWKSTLAGSMAIAAVIVSPEGEIISEGRNRVAEHFYPNFLIAHAETEAVRNLDVTRCSNPRECTLYAGLEPCPMCFGTIAMGQIRHVVVAARDVGGGATDLRNASDFLRRKNIQVEFADPFLGYVHNTMEAIRELTMDESKERAESILERIAVSAPESVEVARELCTEGFIDAVMREHYPYSIVFDRIAEELQKRG